MVFLFSRFFLSDVPSVLLMFNKNGQNAWDIPPTRRRGLAPGGGVGEGVECVICVENEQNVRDIR